MGKGSGKRKFFRGGRIEAAMFQGAERRSVASTTHRKKALFKNYFTGGALCLVRFLIAKIAISSMNLAHLHLFALSVAVADLLL